MICLHCNRDILAYQDRTPLASGGYVHTECYPAYRKERDAPAHWTDTAVAILIIVGVVVVVWLFGYR